MKVGDLVKVVLPPTRAETRIFGDPVGQLGVIIAEFTDQLTNRQWRIRLVSGELFWFDDNELEVQ